MAARTSYLCHKTVVIEEPVQQPVIYIASQSQHIKNDGVELEKMGMKQQSRMDADKSGSRDERM